jgi:hypothetical protein
MKDDERGLDRASGPRIKAPASLWRALVIGLLAARALSLHGSSDAGATVTVNTYRICFSNGCNHARTNGVPPEPARKTMKKER